MASHSVTAGCEWRSSRQNYGQANNGTGGYNFHQTFTAPDPVRGKGGGLDFASFLYGTPSSGSVQEPALTASQLIYTAEYVQDAYKVNSRLTLNLGLRYEITGPWTERFIVSVYFPPRQPANVPRPPGLPIAGSVGLVAPG